MKIVYLHQYFLLPDMAGGTRSYELARRMAEAGHDVHVVTSRQQSERQSAGWTVQAVQGFHVHWYTVPYSNRMGFRRRLVAFAQFAFAATRRVLALDADLIFASSTPLTIAIPAVIGSKRHRVPMVFEVRDLWPEVPIAMGVLRGPVQQWLARRLEKFAYSNSAHVVALSPGMADGVVRSGYPESRVTVIPNACDTALFQRPPKQLSWGNELDAWLGTRRLVVYCGTLGRANGVTFFVRLAEHAMRIDPQIAFLVVGDGMEYESVRNTAVSADVLGRNLLLKPAIPKNEMPDLLRRATLASSCFINVQELWHNSANKFFDALAAGRPVVINYEGWQKEILERTGAGLAVSSADPEGAARAVCDFVGDDARIERAKNAALSLAAHDFDRDQLAQRLVGVLENVSNEASRQAYRKPTIDA